MEYNNTEEYNSIRTGHTVYISGLPGKNHSFLNNKYGYIKDILLTSHERKTSYVAQVVLFSDGEEYFVNFDYIFRMSRFNDLDAKAIVWEQENPVKHYIYKKSLIHTQPFRDENEQFLAVCNDIYGRKHVLLLSGIN